MVASLRRYEPDQVHGFFSAEIRMLEATDAAFRAPSEY